MKRDLFISALLLSLLLALAPAAAGQKVRLRSKITPECGSSSNLKFADIWADGNIAVMGSYSCRGAFIFDVSDPDRPTLANWYDPSPTQAFLEAIVIGNRAYFGSGGPTPSGTASAGDGVHIVDVSDPTQPQLLGKVNSTSGGGFNGIHEMVVFDQGGQRFLVENFNSFATKILKVINVTDPANPVFVRDISPTEISWVHAMHIRGNKMYTSGWGTSSVRGRTEIYDISNIATQAPALLGYIEDPSSSLSNGNNMHSSWTSEDGNYLYSAREVTNSNGPSPGDVRVYDVSDPSTPLLVDRVTMADLGLNAVTPHNPVVMGSKLYVSWYQAGIQVFDITKPADLVRIGQYDTFSPAFLGRNEKASLSDEPWDLICGRDNLQNALPTTYNGTWAVFPFLGEDKVLIGEMNEGLLIVDVTGTSRLPKNTIADFDGDGKTDVSAYRPDSGTWYVQRSSDMQTEARPWGVPTDQIVAGDYDGDGKADHAVFRGSNGYWYIFNSTGSISYIYWGEPGDIPVPADYDADGRTDVAVYRPSTGIWYIWQSTLGFKFIYWGASIDKPVAGDFDGDGKADTAVFRPTEGVWYVYPSSSSIPLFISFGAPGDIPVSADFTGDGQTDFCVYRPSNGYWYVFDMTGPRYIYQAWGVAEDIPVPGDYDRDGKADFTVYRPSDKVWYRINSSNGTFDFRFFGEPGDVPVPMSNYPR